MLSTSPRQDKQRAGLIHSDTMITLENINADIIGCTRCPRLVVYREAVAEQKRRQYREWSYWGKPIPGFGDPRARLYILGLAPAAHGGNRTGRIFTGDRSGDWLYEALYRFGFANQASSTHADDGLILTDCYIGATVRCAPPANKPTLDEFTACRPFVLGELRELRRMRVVVALGQIAFDHYLKANCELGFDRPRPRPKFGHGVMYRLSWGVTLIGSYHPSQQNTFTGKLTRTMFHRIFSDAKRCLSTSPTKNKL
jgi:uracil-DNA glycosylase family 4